MHLKRKNIGKFWPIERTGSKYVALASHDKKTSMPLIVVLRDILGIVKTKKEMKNALKEKKIIVNGKFAREQNQPLGLFDCLSLPSEKKYYRVHLKNRFQLNPISEKDAETRIYKVISKKMLSGKKIQLNLSSGKNLVSSDKINTGEFVLMNIKNNKILKKIKLEKDTSVLVIAGKHAGEEGKVSGVTKEGENEVAVIKTNKGEIKTNIKNIFITE